MLFIAHTAIAQTLDDYVSEVRGDTLVIKTYSENDLQPDALVNAIDLDVDAPATRVYELKRGGLYWVTAAIASPTDRELNISGEGNIPVQTGDDELGPPIFSGTTLDGTPFNGGMIAVNGDVTLKNGMFLSAATDGSVGWSFMDVGSPDLTITLENILAEHTLWVFFQSNAAAGTKMYIRDSYFVNRSGFATRRNGGVYDNVSNNTHTFDVENTTHVMASGMMYKFRNYPINEAIFNHNTFVNASGQLFTTFGYQSNWVMTNNLFINSNVQAYAPGLDGGETDQDFLPMGIVNIDTLRTIENGQSVLQIPEEFITENYPDISPSDFGPDDRKVLVDANGVYWDPRLSQIVDQLNTNNVQCPTEDGCVEADVTWETQMITMNSRTQAMFDDNDTYPYLTEGSWYMAGDPQFTEDNGLMTNMVDSLIKWSVAAVPADNDYIMHIWRSEENPATIENFTFPDWPVNADLSYSNSTYLNGGIGGYPLGDLNWFPEEKASWLAQRDAERTAIENALESGTTLTSNERAATSVPKLFELNQNYPNPFNPTTEISYELSQSANVEIAIYNSLGKKVATLVNNRFQQAGTHSVSFDATGLSSGTYFYTLRAGDFVQSKTMTLIK